MSHKVGSGCGFQLMLREKILDICSMVYIFRVVVCVTRFIFRREPSKA